MSLALTTTYENGIFGGVVMSRGTPRRMKMLPYSPRTHSYLLTRDFQRSIREVFPTPISLQPLTAPLAAGPYPAAVGWPA